MKRKERWQSEKAAEERRGKEMDKSEAVNEVESSESVTRDQKQNRQLLKLRQIYWKSFYLWILT